MAVNVFIAMGTQWQMGMRGAVGLRYEALPPVFDALRVPRGDRPQVFADVRVMEQEALRIWREAA